MHITIPVSPGELIDKITILEIKIEEFSDAAKLKNVQHEFSLLAQILNDEIKESLELKNLHAELKAVNKKIWDSENLVREYWNDDAYFVEGARNSHYNNDERARIKKAINDLLGSSITEEKTHPAYERLQ